MPLQSANVPSIIVLMLPYFILGYFCGAIPFGMVFGKFFCGIDPRTAGSCNVGATNIARLCGKKWGAATLICDASKGLLPILLITGIGPYTGESAFIAASLALGAIFGHMFSCFLKFKGGKGVATTVGVFLVMHPLSLVISASLCIFAIWRTGFVSVGSLVMASLLPPLLFFFGQVVSGVAALIISALVILAHRENIKRLLKGTEKTWFPAKKDSQDK